MHGSPCPIAVVPHGWSDGALRTIGVAYVDTEEGRNALRGAYELARRAGATLRVLTVAKGKAGSYVETETRHPGQRGKRKYEIDGERRLRTEAAVRATVSELGDDHVTVEVDTFLEDPAEVLIRVSENVDLLVCGSRGYGPLRAVLLGGVTRRVTAAAKCPVLVLPRGVGFMDDASPAQAEQPATA
jgi:nucleotide-binding universal stress UspA family protein